MSQDDPAGMPSTAGAGPAAIPLLPFAVGFAAFGAAFCAYKWAAPRGVETLDWFLVSLGLVGLWVVALAVGFSRGGTPLAWGFRSQLPVLPYGLVALAPAAFALLGGGWAGGWELGAAGAAAGGMAGVAAAWLFTRRVLPGMLGLASGGRREGGRPAR